MHRSLSAQLRAAPSYGSFRRLRESDNCAEGQEEDDAEESWVMRTLPERWHIVEKFDTISPYYKQKVVIDLGMTTAYRREGQNYIIRAEIFDILWDSNMFSNADDCRGWFVDALEIQFQPMWNQDEIITGALYPKTTNTSAYFGKTAQVTSKPLLLPTLPSFKSFLTPSILFQVLLLPYKPFLLSSFFCRTLSSSLVPHIQAIKL